MKLMVMILSLLVAMIAEVQAQERHPRVAELEDQFKQETQRYLEHRFPGTPFAVTVSIEPVRRQGADAYQPKGEVLPFLELDEETIRDEWDDPTASLYVLVNRIKRAVVTISVPATVSDEEIVEIRDTLSRTLRLIPSRDEVVVQRREWTLPPDLKIYGLAAIGALLFFLLGLFIISRMSMRRMSAAMASVQSAVQQKAEGQAVGAGAPMPLPSSDDVARSGPGASGTDVKFNDPIKTREVIGQRIKDLLAGGGFPRLEDMIALDRLGQQDPPGLGALLVEFPVDIQKQLLSLSHGTHWMDAFVEPGELSSRCLELLEQLCRVQPTQRGRDWEDLLIHVWRLGPQRATFLRQLPQGEALAILHEIPKNISIPTAREAFPGGWATLLDPEHRPVQLLPNRIYELTQVALSITPPLGFHELGRYRQDKDLLLYVRTASMTEEKEVYQAAPEGSILHKVRPPFFAIFGENEPDGYENFVNSVALEEWALALFNVPRDSRKRVERFFNQRQKVLYLERLRAYDARPPSRESIGLMREKLAERYEQFLTSRALQKPNVAAGDSPTVEGADSEQAA